jgi:hypothetical protein
MNKKGENNFRKFSDYLNDKMSNPERNRFERELERSPFDAEALEGFEGITNDEIETSINFIHYRISRKNNRKKHIYWAAAASVLLLVSIGVSLMMINEKPVVPKVTENTILESPKNDSNKTEQELAQAPSETERTVKGIDISKSKKQITEKPGNEEKVLNFEFAEPKKDERSAANNALPVDTVYTKAEQPAIAFSAAETISNFDTGLMHQVYNVSSNPGSNAFSGTTEESLKNRIIKKALRPSQSVFYTNDTAINMNPPEKAKSITFSKMHSGMKLDEYIDNQAILPLNYPNKKVTLKIGYSVNTFGMAVAFKNLNQADTILFNQATEWISDWYKANMDSEKIIPGKKEIRIVFRAKAD